MAWVDEQLSAQFYEWERRGRGYQVWPLPVVLEPPFKSFPGHVLRTGVFDADDGRRPTILSSFVQRLARSLKGESPPLLPEPVHEQEPEPESLERDELVELQVSLPAKLNATSEVFAHFLGSLAYLREPLVFELIGLPETILTQFVAHPADVTAIERQLQAHFPEAVLTREMGVLESAWTELAEADTAIVEFGLAREFVFPLATDAADTLVGLTAALASVQPGELGLFQVLFQPVAKPWAESALRAVSDFQGKPLFVNAPELLAQGKRKVSKPLFATVVRIAVRCEDEGRPWEIAREMAAALGGLADIESNELIPLSNDDYPFEDHLEDVPRRQSRRSGMILNRDELLGLVHLPSAVVRTAKLRREIGKSRPVPKVILSQDGLLLGSNDHAGQRIEVKLTTDQRVRHTHVIGASGTGKSTLLFNLIRQDIDNGDGVAVLDPHGDLVDRILGCIPEHRIGDVVLVDPADETHSVGFNILSAHSDLEKNLLASDLVSVFQRLSTSWGDQMGSVFSNAILAFLESSTGGTLADLRRFLIEPAFRNQFLATVRDPDIVYYWQKGFPQLSGNKSIGPVLTRLETFLSPKPIRYMVSQKENRLDFARILDSGKIFLAKLPQGQMGKENAFLLGSLLVAKFQQLAMSRQAQRAELRRPFWLYVDEFQNFITPSMAEILTGARKYRLGLILAHQELRQLQRDTEVASAVLSNPYTRVVFRVGDADARALESGFAHFEARDLQNLGTGEAICRMERSDYDFNLRVPLPEEGDLDEAEKTRQRVITVSREKYAKSRAEVEAELFAQYRAANENSVAKEPLSKEKPKSTPTETVPSVAQTGPAPTETPPIRRAEILPQSAKSPTEPKPARQLPEPGRGGAQHTALQKRLKQVAEELGFHGTIEKEVPNGSIDLVLQKGDYSIACEISFTTTIDSEVGHIINRRKAGYNKIAVICTEESRLAKIEKAVLGCLSADEASHVSYFIPETFIAHLQELARRETNTPTLPELKLGKYKVKTIQVPLTEEERKQKEAAMVKMLADAMKKPKKPKRSPGSNT